MRSLILLFLPLLAPESECDLLRDSVHVKRFSFTTSTENSTTLPKMWALERNCTKHCEPGCIVIGERTKLYACTSCCTTSLCNYGSGAEEMHLLDLLLVSTVAVFLVL
ncbi:hypothetical protein SFRURICE_013020 [Spodoptera frugiperda]|nr:hypothetical protein SFRURICE_013020 [Spodoptera frugiperda]